MTEIRPKPSKDEFARRGEELFDQEIRQRVASEPPEHFLAIDVNTGDFEVDARELAAIHRLRARKPDAEVWLRRVGSPAAHHIGWIPQRPTP